MSILKSSTISVIVHTRNSAHTLDRALSSVRQLADQLIIMDMESEDDSVKIARNHGAEIFTTKNIGYVEPARNEALKHAHGDWIFLLDADEWIESSLAEKLRAVANSSSSAPDAYELPRLNFIFGLPAGSGWWPDYNLRFFRKGVCQWSSVIHAQPKVVGEKVQLPPDESYAIRHENYTSVSQFVDRMNKYTSLESQTSARYPLRAFVDEFLRRFAVSGGYKDGVYGESLSLLQAMYSALVCIKHLEKKGFSKKASGNVEDLRYMADVAFYWVRSIELERERNPFKRLLIRIKRKLQL